MKEKALVTLTVSRGDLEALELVLESAREDWQIYVESGRGPADFGRQEWRLHKRKNDAALSAVTRLLAKALKALDLEESKMKL